jgi:hypothetical protein
MYATRSRTYAQAAAAANGQSRPVVYPTLSRFTIRDLVDVSQLQLSHEGHSPAKGPFGMDFAIYNFPTLFADCRLHDTMADGLCFFEACLLTLGVDYHPADRGRVVSLMKTGLSTFFNPMHLPADMAARLREDSFGQDIHQHALTQIFRSCSS